MELEKIVYLSAIKVVFMKRLVSVLIAILALGIILCQASVPKPAIVQAPGDWTARSQFTVLQQVWVQESEESRPKLFWYMILTVINETDRDLEFYPKYDLMTDTFQVIAAGKDVIPVVFEQIKNLHKDNYPFLEMLDETSNKILQGQDNAKDIALVWPDFDPKAKSIKVFITGLSSEVAGVNDPFEKDQSGSPKKVFLRKTLELDYDLSGDPQFRSEVQVELKGKSWIMR